MLKDYQMPRGRFRNLYYENNEKTPYTSSQIPEDDYLQTDVWRKIRDKRLEHDNYQCQKCGTAQNLQVHHLQYPDVWGKENIEFDLITLCKDCHRLIHSNDIKKRNNENV